MNENRMIQRLCSHYRERAVAAEAELSEAREEIRKLRAALRNAHEANEALYAWTGGASR